MRRILAALILLGLCVSMTGCAPLDYIKANKLYREGQYAAAQECYQALGDFANSADMAHACGQRAAYEQAEAFYAAGNYEQAEEMYLELGMYADSPLKVVLCRYVGGQACLAAAEYEKAVEWLKPLGGYEDSAELTKLARWNWLGQEKREKVMEETADRYYTIAIEPVETDMLQLTMMDKGLLLGLPYETELTVTLVRNQPEAAYTLTYTSTDVNTITETAAGTVTLRGFPEGLPVAEFTQTVTDEDGNETASKDPADAIMMPTVMAQAVADVMADLPVLLEESGVDITVEDLGF